MRALRNPHAAIRWRRLAGFAITLLVPMLTIVATPAAAKPMNIEFRFTPFFPSGRDGEKVTTLAGTLELELNGVPMAEEPLESKAALLMGTRDANPDVFPAITLSALDLQPLLRRGDNLMRLRFTPKDRSLNYRSQFRWTVIEDQTITSTTASGSELTTNHGKQGGEDRDVRGPVTVEHAFQAPFARVEPWHDAPAVTALSPADHSEILGLIRRRAALFQPDFSAAYRYLASLPKDRALTLDVPALRRQACLEAGYATGMRVAAPNAADLRLIPTGSPVVVARGVGDFVFRFPEEPGMAERFEKLPNDVGFCFILSFNQLFPKQFLLVKGVGGKWQILP